MRKEKTVLDSYKNISKWYDEHRDRTLFEKAWLDKAITHLKAGASMLDLGCGMGEPIANYFIEKGYDVTGIDGCKELIEMAKERLPKGRFFVADIRKPQLDKTFDLVIAWNSFFHLNQADQRDMFSVFRNYVKVDGILMFTTGTKSGEVWSNNGGENLYHASLSPKEYKHLLKENGFELIDCKINDKDCNGHTIWLAKCKQS